jgi:hypothetical protein
VSPDFSTLFHAPQSAHWVNGHAADFDRVTSIDFSTPEQITLAAESGATVTVPVRHEFVLSKAMRD